MSSNLPHNKNQKGIARRLLDLPLSNFPSLWEDFANQLNLTDAFKDLTVYEEKNHVIVEASMPGLKADDIEISFENGFLQIHGEEKKEDASKDRKYYQREERSYSFRTSLPQNIDENDEPKASYKDGVLKIAFTKSKTSKNKKIAIKNG
jgi:HSP20 family protein